MFKTLLRVLVGAPAKEYPITKEMEEYETRNFNSTRDAYVFHGSCLDCNNQEWYGLSICRKCRYHKCSGAQKDYSTYPYDNKEFGEALMNIAKEDVSLYWPGWSDEELFIMCQKTLSLISRHRTIDANTKINIWAVMNTYIFTQDRAEGIRNTPAGDLITRSEMFYRIDKILKTVRMDWLVANEK